ncbi:MAG: acyl-CoA dehydratase activase-related protein, partial [Candidatus Latescibacterota bacterium]
KIGEVVFLQGGTAFNRSIASAFATVLGKQVIVPPYNGVIGAVGAALLAREKTARAGAGPSTFRGFTLGQVSYELREFTCKACSNLCLMQEFTVEGEKTYWGDQCSWKFRRKQVTGSRPVIPDLLARREELLFARYDPAAPGTATVGLPRGMYVHEQFPFWNTFFRQLGYRVLLSDDTNARVIRTGVETSVAEPCLPVQAYHGHVQDLVEKGVDWLFIPNVLNAETPFPEVNSHYCLWGQTLPFVVRSAPAFEAVRDRILSPTLRFRDGSESIARSLTACLEPLGVRGAQVRRALAAAYQRQEEFRQVMLAEGQQALQVLEEAQQIGIVLVGRAYNVHDRGMILDIGGKLRDYYGVNVVPMEFLPVDEVDVSDVNSNMYWSYGRKLLAAARIAGQHPNLHLIHLTCFKCGPDSYIKHYLRSAAGKPLLTLQFDGHGNDAGYLTRCEAYLHSKGVFEPAASRRRAARALACGDGRLSANGRERGTLVGRILYVPRMSADGAAAAAAAYRAFGIDARVVPESDAHSLELARQHVNGDECFPQLVTLGDFLRVMEDPSFDPERTAFLLPTASGPCRFGQYRQLLERLLQQQGRQAAMVVSPTSTDGYRDFGEQAADLPRLLWRAMLCADGLRRLLLQTRPYEEEPGETDRVHARCLEDLCRILERPGVPAQDGMAALVACMEEAVAALAAVPGRYERGRPLVGVVGEIYCRMDTFANGDLVRRVERLGGEVWLSHVSEWVFWVNFNERFNLRLQGRALSARMLRAKLREMVQRRDEHRLHAPLARRLEGYEEAADIESLVAPATPYLPYLGALGEMVLGVSTAIHLQGKGADGIIDICPFSCMNGIVCEAVYPRLSRDLDGIPIRNFYFDGTESDQDREVEIFLELARAYQRRKRTARRYPDHFGRRTPAAAPV